MKLSPDPFVQDFLSQLSPKVASSFSDEQLDALKLAFGARSRGSHAVDLRFSVPFFGWRRVYFVFLAGVERRRAERRAFERVLRPLWTIANALTLTVFGFMFVASLCVTLYIGKRAIGLDIVPGVDMLPDKTIERALR